MKINEVIIHDMLPLQKGAPRSLHRSGGNIHFSDNGGNSAHLRKLNKLKNYAYRIASWPQSKR